MRFQRLRRLWSGEGEHEVPDRPPLTDGPPYRTVQPVVEVKERPKPSGPWMVLSYRTVLPLFMVDDRPPLFDVRHTGPFKTHWGAELYLLLFRLRLERADIAHPRRRYAIVGMTNMAREDWPLVVRSKKDHPACAFGTYGCSMCRPGRS